jgi:hypothetical protein
VDELFDQLLATLVVAPAPATVVAPATAATVATATPAPTARTTRTAAPRLFGLDWLLDRLRLGRGFD